MNVLQTLLDKSIRANKTLPLAFSYWSISSIAADEPLSYQNFP
jgi:hypothetical protein